MLRISLRRGCIIYIDIIVTAGIPIYILWYLIWSIYRIIRKIVWKCGVIMYIIVVASCVIIGIICKQNWCRGGN